ncbi:MAG: geranylgeranyl reductase family protein [Bacteroidales bacterium]|nr:geranylgeranyl reductase family protein [Bacteroidales bacterium]
MMQTDVAIVGAGPAGTFAALFLAKFGVKCKLIDKQKFPRDKICGDGISGWVLTVLNELDKELLAKLSKQDFLVHSHGMRIVSPNSSILDLPFMDDGSFGAGIPPGFICRRIDFDNFMMEEAKRRPEIEVLEEIEINEFRRGKSGIVLNSKNRDVRISAKLVIFASGVNSKFMKEPGGILKDKKFTMTGIRAYYKGVSGCHPQNYVELHFLKGLLPGYFWVFPLPGEMANVGVGLDRHRIGKKKINLKKIMLEAIATNPYLKTRFKDAEMIENIKAWQLPLWDGRRKLSGERFLMAGDAASLVDPVTGEGIGHAAITGMLAAKQARRSLEENDFSSAFMSRYDDRLYKKVGKELDISKKILPFIQYERVFNRVINRASGSKVLKEKLILALTDLEERKKLKNPMLYLKIMLGM